VFELIGSRFSQYRLTITAGAWLIFLFLLTGGTLYRLIAASIEKERFHRQELFDRDLRALAGRLDADERYVLERNLDKLLPEERPIQPLLLPRQYFVSLPAANSTVTPRSPPRNCYVDLVVSSTSVAHEATPDRFCAYFTGNRGPGSYLFFAMSIDGQSIVTLRPGDIALNADAMRISIRSGNLSGIWWLTFQAPRQDPISSRRFEITAIREDSSGRMERDSRFEGWAYMQHQADGTRLLHLVARLDYHAIVPREAPAPSRTVLAKPTIKKGVRGQGRHRAKSVAEDASLEPWPPKDWQNVEIGIGRKSFSRDTNSWGLKQYGPRGVTNLSVSVLSAPFVNAYADLRIKQKLDSGEVKVWSPPPPAKLVGKVDSAESWIRVVDGDLLIRQKPLIRTQIVPDTSLVFEATHPGAVVEKGVWQTAALLLLVLFGFLFLVRYVFISLLKPVWTLSAKSAALMRNSVDSEKELPYGDRRDEIGTLSTAFNGLLRETRTRMVREQEDRERRNEEARLKHLDEVKTREISLKTIGHEIRSPLQALLGMHSQDDLSRRYIDRMVRAVANLFGKAGPASFDSVPIQLEQVDIAEFLSELASNAAAATTPISDVDYTGPANGIVCHLDPDAFEDTVSHILENAARFRTASSPIRIRLLNGVGTVSIAIGNDGPHIPEDLLETIFEYGFSPTENNDGSNQGIGLFAARNYVSRMSGSIVAHNTPTGVEFTISFPLAK